MVPAKTFSQLFVLGRVQRIAWYDDVGFALVTICPETVAATDDEGYDTKHLQVKQEYGGIHPAIGYVLQFRVLQFDRLVYCLIHNVLFICKNKTFD
jgi:hypothetical protein